MLDQSFHFLFDYMWKRDSNNFVERLESFLFINFDNTFPGNLKDQLSLKNGVARVMQ